MNTEPEPAGGDSGPRQTVPCGVDGCDPPAASTLTHTDGGREHLCEDHIAEFYITGDDGTLRDRLIADSRNRICETGGCQQLADQTLVEVTVWLARCPDADVKQCTPGSTRDRVRRLRRRTR